MYKLYVTGHRELHNAEEIRSMIAYSLDYFLEKNTELVCVSNLAAGADTIFIEEALKRKIRTNIVLPFQKDEYKKDFTSHDLNVFENIIEQTGYKTFSEIAGNVVEERNKAYLQAGQQMVDNCDAVMAIWDGEDARGMGGTSDIVKYATEKKKQIHYIRAVRNSGENADNRDEKLSVLQQEFQQFDQSAIKNKNRFQLLWFWGILFGLFAVTTFSANLCLVSKAHTSIKFYLSLSEIIFLLLSFYFLGNLANKIKKKYILARLEAELIRGRLWFHASGISYDEIDLKQNGSLNNDGHQSEKNNLEDSKRILWIYATEQTEYQKIKRIRRFKHQLHRAHLFLEWVKYLFFIIVGSICIVEGIEYFHHSENDILEKILHWLEFLWILLPPTFAAMEGVIYFNEWKNSIQSSNLLVDQLIQIKEKLLYCNNHKSFDLIKSELISTFTIEGRVWIEKQQQKQLQGKL